MSDVWVVIIEDRHVDVDARPFSSEDAAVRYAREQAEANAYRPESIEEVEITPTMANDGWVLCMTYSTESDCVRVVKRTMDSVA